MVHRASISPLTLVRYRYNDLIEPAKKQHYTLPPLEKFCADYNNVFLDSSNEYGEPCWSEDWGPELFFRKTATNAPVATAWPAKKSASVHIAAKDLTGGTRMTRERDPAGFDFCRIKVALNSEVENIWMNPGFAEIGYTVPPDQAGEWYVFATVRLGATVPRDPAAAYAGIYVPWFVNGVKYNDVNEIADLPLSGAAGEEGWQTLCLGRRILVPGSRIWVMPGTVYPTRFQDVKNFVLVDPAAFATNSANCLCADVRKMDGRGLARGYDAIDRFDYLRSTNGAPVAAKVTDKAAGDKMVFARVRIGASAPLDQEAAFISVTSGTGTNRATLATTRISGSPGDESWQVVCAGRLNLTTNMTLSVTAGTNHPPRFVDVRDFQIVKPELFGEK